MYAQGEGVDMTLETRIRVVVAGPCVVNIPCLEFIRILGYCHTRSNHPHSG